ncbi:hypothetical protein SAMN04488109_1764 [Chryseolinea serpens]|uniref:Uncharacterized protein n=1 Tax=Chryseolinea serpens TaxID=947013 RepID=A0A1M5MIV2_9BACT|nr:hypothetical protein [Chryseolinea serpens]SHG77131.1 hypothetical protein SAMN04488109_1764 [Chryseolinea serpens]
MKAKALEIKTIPTLTGDSAIRFMELVERNQDIRIPESKLEAMRKRAEQILKKAKI